MIQLIGKVRVLNAERKPKRFVICELIKGELFFLDHYDDYTKAKEIASKRDNALIVEMSEKTIIIPSQYGIIQGVKE